MKQANLADQVFDAAKTWLQRNVSPLIDRIKALEERPPVAGLQGEKGDPGRDGIDGTNGQDGKDADPEVIKSLIVAAVAEIPPTKDGLPGQDGRDGVDGKDGAPGERGIDGKDIDPDAVKQAIEAIVATIPRPVDGINGKDGRDGVDGKDGAPGERGADGLGIKGDPGMDGRDGRDGEPGRDAVQIDILQGIDPSKRYQRGTFVKFGGGLIRSFRVTDPLAEGDLIEKAGWEVVVQGVADLRFEREDDGRTVKITMAYTGSPATVQRLTFPAAIYRGIYQAGTIYDEGDMATWDGSVWNAVKSTSDKPGASDAWRLSVKRGRDGRDGVRGEKGERGAEGRAGRDLTQMTSDGRKY